MSWFWVLNDTLTGFWCYHYPRFHSLKGKECYRGLKTRLWLVQPCRITLLNKTEIIAFNFFSVFHSILWFSLKRFDSLTTFTDFVLFMRKVNGTLFGLKQSALPVSPLHSGCSVLPDWAAPPQMTHWWEAPQAERKAPVLQSQGRRTTWLLTCCFLPLHFLRMVPLLALCDTNAKHENMEWSYILQIKTVHCWDACFQSCCISLEASTNSSW